MVAKLEILPRHLSTLRGIHRKFVKSSTVPEPDSWRARSNEEIWRYIVAQVMVVGGSASADRFRASPDLLRKASYRRLCKLNPSDARADINSVLREAGTRYASSNSTKCRKTAALAHNLRGPPAHERRTEGLSETRFAADWPKCRPASHQVCDESVVVSP